MASKQRTRVKVKTKRKRKGGTLRRRVTLAFLFLAVMVAIIAAFGYYSVYSSNFDLGEKEHDFLYIRSSDSYHDVMTQLQNKGCVKNQMTLEWVMDRKNYPNHVIAGKFKIVNGMNNNDFVNMLRSGMQEVVNVTLNMERNLPQVASTLSGLLDVDSTTVLEQLLSPQFLTQHNLTKETAICMFVPNTYQFYWATSEEKVLERFWQEYNDFWGDKRKKKAEKWGLTPNEITTLASIVFKETTKKVDAPKIAGVYLNRIREGMPLQADPTLIFALNDTSIRRVLNVHKQIDSPYNTYKYRGLPPGPISMPSTTYIDAVLDAPRHDYLYFCAKEDFSGYSNFAKTYMEHLANARKYQNALNKRKIFS